MTYLPDSGYILKEAENQIFNSFGDRVSVSAKAKALIKFGRNEAVGTSKATVMQFQGTEIEEVLQTSNTIDSVVTTDNAFTGTVTIEGHTISGGELTFATQTKTLTGQTAVTLDTPLARVNRIFISSNDALASDSDKIFVFQSGTTTNGIPDTTADIHLLMDGEWGQSQKCQTSVSKDDYWILTLVYGGILRKQTASANICIQIKPVAASQWRTIFDMPATTTGTASLPPIQAPPAFIVPKNYDVRMVAEASTTGVEVTAGIGGYLAKIVT